MATKTTGVWGIDLGQCALKAVRIENTDGEIVATAFDYIEHPKFLNQPDAEPDQMIREALQKFLSRNTVAGDIIAISVPSQSGLARFVKLPPVEEKKIADIVRFEAKQQIPFSLDEVVWDYQKIGAGMVTDGFAMDTEIGLFAMKRDKVTSYLEHFRDVNVDVHIVQMSPLALCNFVAYDLLQTPADDGESAKKNCIVALDIGTDSSNLVVTDGNKIIWQRPIPLGGNHFTRALTKEPFKLTFAKAEHLKRNATKSGPELKRILTSLKPVLNDFVQEVQRSLGYFTNTHRDAQVQYMIGLGNAFRLPGFQRFLSEKLQMDVRKLSKIEKLAGDSVVGAPVFTENILAFAVAYGLALQGLSLARLQTNLLPPEIRLDRLIKAKKPWAVAAAAVLLLGAGGLLVGKGKAYNEYNPEQADLKAALTEASGVISDKNDKDTQFKKKEELVASVQSELKAFGGLRQEDWVMLNKFIDESLPRPVIASKDGKFDMVGVSPINPDAFRKYWTKVPEAAEANTEYFRAQLEGKPLKEAARAFKDRKFKDRVEADGGRTPKDKLPGLLEKTDFLESNLFLFSIETVTAKHTQSLALAWTNAKSINERRAPTEAKGAIWANGEPPSDPGWIIAVRGYTYHYATTKFVLATLGNNLAASFGIKQQFLDVNERPKETPSGPAGPTGPGQRPAGSPVASTPKPAGSVAAAPPTESPVKVSASHPVVGKVNQIILLTTSEKNSPVPKEFGNLFTALDRPPAVPARGSGRGSGASKASESAPADPLGAGESQGPGNDRGVTSKGQNQAKAKGGEVLGKDGTVKSERFQRAAPEGTTPTEFLFLIFWKGPGREDYSLPGAAASNVPQGPRGLR